MGIRVISTMAQQIRVRIALVVSNTRLLIRIAIVAASVSALSIPVAMAGQKVAVFLFAVGPLAISILLIANAICMRRDAAPVTRAWLTAFVAVVGREDAAIILTRATPWASAAFPVSRRQVLHMTDLIRSERRQAAREIHGLRSDQIAKFLEE
jgi:hypothetical protein